MQESIPGLRSIIMTGVVCAVFVVALTAPILAKNKPAAVSAKTKEKTEAPGKSEASSRLGGQLESYRDLINKARNLTLQRDRLQASQVLIRGIQREPKNSPAQKELVRALDELTGVFYTDKAQSLHAMADSMPESKAKEAIDRYQEALVVEDGNVSVLKAMARAHLRLADCDRADAAVKSAEAMNPYSPEVRLLRLQVLDCQKAFDALAQQMGRTDVEMEQVDRFLKGLQLKELLRKKDLKKVKSFLQSWETSAPDYPEVFFWKWQMSLDAQVPDRVAANRYVSLCDNLTPRRRQSLSLDVDLCRGRAKAEEYLKNSGLQQANPIGEDDED